MIEFWPPILPPRDLIAAKLARRFIADDPPPALVDKAAARFLATHGDIGSVLRIILLDGLASASPNTSGR